MSGEGGGTSGEGEPVRGLDKETSGIHGYTGEPEGAVYRSSSGEGEIREGTVRAV